MPAPAFSATTSAAAESGCVSALLNRFRLASTEPARNGSTLRPAIPKSSGTMSYSAISPSFQFADVAGAVQGDLVEPVAVHHQHVFAAEQFRDFRQRALPAGAEHAQHLPSRPGRIGERAQHVHQGGRAEFPAYGRGVPGGAVVGLGEHEADAHLADAMGHLGGGDADIGAGRFEHVGAAAETGHLAVAVLGHVSAGGRGGGRRPRWRR